MKKDFKKYQYTECGLDNVFLHGLDVVTDDAGQKVITIPNILGLHKAISEVIILQNKSISGKELRFLRTEMGMTQTELGELVHRERLTIGRWESGECSIESAAEVVIRKLVAEKLNLDESIETISRYCIDRADSEPIRIDGSNPKNYKALQPAA